MSSTYKFINEHFQQQFDFNINEITYTKIVDYMYIQKDSSSLAVTRILFGVAMLFDIPDERGGAIMDERWGDPLTCHFPLIPFIRAVSMPYMALVYAAMWLGALGIMLGYKYRLTASMFTISYWYLFLIEKSFWNNHSYLFGLVGLLLACTQANCYWSIDAYLDTTTRRETVPYWNYFVLKYQFFILYFMAGLKKGTAEWLTGYSVQNLSEHWVFEPFKLFLTIPQIDYIVVHWFIFVFDLTVAMWMMWSRSRHVAMVFCALFHLMNSRLFRIGMFPWVCLATMPLYYSFNWPKILIKLCKKYIRIVDGQLRRWYALVKTEKTCENEANAIDTENKCNTENKELEIDQEIKDSGMDPTDTTENSDEMISNTVETDIDESGIASKCNEMEEENKLSRTEVNVEGKDVKRNRITMYFIVFHILSQAFLPFSHFITKGFNNWTDGLYGYSWDMMVHTWDTYSVVVKVIDNERNKEFYVDPQVYAPNDRWTRHGDMVYQYARCLEKNLIDASMSRTEPVLSNNLSLYIDVWCSLNGRFTQRMFDPNVDILKAFWSLLTRTPYLMPLLDEASNWRSRLDEIRDYVRSWNNYSDVMFIADFPGYVQEKYIPPELHNVTLTVLEGMVAYEPEVTKQQGQSYRLSSGNRIDVVSGIFHKVLNIGDTPSFYMYTFFNSTDIYNNITTANISKTQPFLPIGKELIKRFTGMATFADLVIRNICRIVFVRSQCY
ncbi:vitamin K-dependent gamma-carboxylase [Achroia grisella]|uniref:vitamin K-dependent gamma-carboxylase n=1 Tax=Achroia grisella TaxID=688607 RepID=UPI0027D34277|nr:vitamin K-dependent gamma-carboxylase [Achroia grisella]